MDTRNKILTHEAAERLLRSRPDARVVTGYFDPVLAAHARRLSEIGDRVIVCVRRSDSSLLDQRARAELVASLSSVEFVIPEECLPLAQSAHVIREEEVDLKRAAAFVEHVRRRSG